MNACWIGCGCSTVPRPSSVTTSAPTARDIGVTQERTARPFMITAQAPHWSSPQPNLGPSSPRSLRSTYSSGVSGSASTLYARPFTVTSTAGLSLPDPKGAPIPSRPWIEPKRHPDSLRHPLVVRLTYRASTRGPAENPVRAGQVPHQVQDVVLRLATRPQDVVQAAADRTFSAALLVDHHR